MPRPRLRSTALAVGLALFSAAELCAQNPVRVISNQPALPESMSMRVDGESVTAEIRATPLQKALDELAARSGLVFEVAALWNPPVSVTLYKVGLEEAVRRITANGDSIFYYERDAAGQSRLRYVRVFPRGTRGQSAGLVQLGTGTVTRRAEQPIENPEQALRVLGTESASRETRQKAVEVLVASRSEAAVQALTRALADGAVEIRVAAVEGLAALGARGALERIVELLKDAHPGVRQSAAEAVAILGTAADLRNVQALTRDSDPAVARAAEQAVQRLSGRRP